MISDKKQNIILVSHEATRTGAPLILLKLVKYLSKDSSLNIIVILLKGGELKNEFQEYAETVILNNNYSYLNILCHEAISKKQKLVIIANSVGSWNAVQIFGNHGIKCICWIHENITVIDEFLGGNQTMEIIDTNSLKILVPTNQIAVAISDKYKIELKKIEVVHYGFEQGVSKNVIPELRANIRKELGLGLESKLVIGCGTVELRKGTDLFIQIAKKVISESVIECESKGDVPHFVWVGRFERDSESWITHDLNVFPDFIRKNIHFVGVKSNSSEYIAASDAFALTSREETGPLVVHEAIVNNIPVVMFDGPIGAKDVIPEKTFILADYLSTESFSAIIKDSLKGRIPYKRDLDLHIMRSWNGTFEKIKKISYFTSELSLGSSLNPNQNRQDSVLLKDTKGGTSRLKILIISIGPPPIPGVVHVEGGGIRNWGLATGLSQNIPGAEITIAVKKGLGYNESHSSFKGIKILQWDDDNLELIVNQNDVVISSYCLGDYSKKISEYVKDDQLLVWDCYVPINIEVAATGQKGCKSDDYHEMRSACNISLARGDLFLCASEVQIAYYMGILSSIGRLTPQSYNKEEILVVPYGIFDENKKNKRSGTQLSEKLDKCWKILWFGGIYPWFDIKPILDAVVELNRHHPTKLTVVGAKNPFVIEESFINKYNEFLTLAQNPKYRDYIELVDWVEYDDRMLYYHNSDIIVQINKEGNENRLAWRTRLMDYIISSTPILTNGGDPLGEELIQTGAALRIDSQNTISIVNQIIRVMSDDSLKDNIKEAISKIREKYRWKKTTSILSDFLLKQYSNSELSYYRAASKKTNVALTKKVCFPNNSKYFFKPLLRRFRFAFSPEFDQSKYLLKHNDIMTNDNSIFNWKYFPRAHYIIFNHPS